ncbi:MAG: hypothetical protein U0992_13315 [Planctomycetaceae bacterium]
MTKSAGPVWCAFLWLAAASSTTAADLLRVEGVTLGFDGTVVLNAFNPVSFELHNDSNDQMNLQLRLTRSNGLESVDPPIGVAPPAEPVFLAPQSSRRVQLFAYVQGVHNDFTLSWGRGDEQRLDLVNNQQLTLGPPATVILYDPEAVSPRGAGLPRFDESFFPISVSGTTGLAAVVLDHAPRWQTAQQAAFLDWLRCGGIVHLLQPSVGEFPTFDGDLALLNAPFDEQRIGAGRVIKHAVPMSQLDRTFAESQLLPRNPLQLKPAPETTDVNAANQNMYSWIDWDVAGQVFNRVRQMTRPDHNWALIYVMSLVYLVLIFPGCWLIGRRKADYRLTYGVMLGAVVLFSMGFKTVGQRGYGEETALHTMTVAQPLTGGRLAFREWGNLFVTNGDDYRIHHKGNGLLYSSGQSNEAVRGWIVSPPAGEFVADVPPFSSRTIASAGVADSGGFTPVVEELQLGDSLSALRFRLDPPLKSPPQAMHALYRDKVYTLELTKEGSFKLSLGGAQDWQGFLKPDGWNQYGMNYGFGYNGNVSRKDLFASGLTPLMAADMRMQDEQTMKRFQLAPDRVRIYLFAETPDSLFADLQFASAPDRLLAAKRAGRVLYAFDLAPPEQ